MRHHRIMIDDAREFGMQLSNYWDGGGLSDIIDVGLALRELDPQSIPINFLLPIEGTPLAGVDYLEPYDCLRILCLMRFLNPRTEIRVSAGREAHLRSLQPLALYPANSVFVSGYLTEPGQAYEETAAMIRDLGFEIEEHREGQPPPADRTGAPCEAVATGG